MWKLDFSLQAPLPRPVNKVHLYVAWWRKNTHHSTILIYQQTKKYTNGDCCWNHNHHVLKMKIKGKLDKRTQINVKNPFCQVDSGSLPIILLSLSILQLLLEKLWNPCQLSRAKVVIHPSHAIGSLKQTCYCGLQNEAHCDVVVKSCTS